MKIIIIHLFHKYIFILVGAFLITVYFWIKFIRERIPKDIPFTNSLLGIMILIEICFIYLFVLYTLIKKDHKSSTISMELLNLLYSPLIAFDTYIKNISWVKHYHKNFIIAFVYGCEYIFKHYDIFYIIFAITPRIVLVTALVIDTFIFAKLYYIYKVLLIGILLFINRYIIYSLKYAKKYFTEKYTLYLDQTYISTPSTTAFNRYYWRDDDDSEAIPENYEEYEVEYEPNVLMCVPLKMFVNYYTACKIHLKKDLYWRFTIAEEYKKKIIIMLKIPSNKYFVDTEYYDIINQKIRNKINNLLQIVIIVEYYTVTKDKKIYKNILKIIYSLHFICWVNILYKSILIFKYNPITDNILLEGLQKFVEPFSGLLI